MRVGPYLLDGYDPATKTAYEFNGCYFHGCAKCENNITDIGKEREEHWKVKEKYLIDNGYKPETMWEHEFKTLKRKDLILKQFIRQREPSFYRTHRWTTNELAILNAVREDNFFWILGSGYTCSRSTQRVFRRNVSAFL